MPHVERLDRADKTARYYRCPVCSNGEVRVDNSVYYGKCKECNATLIDFIPAPHQEDFFLSNVTYRMLIGGFAGGKTSVACAADIEHVLTTPHARLLITAPTLQQVREAVLPELDKFIPPWFLEGGRSKGNPPVYNFINGAQIIVYASDNETKIRSLNLTAFHIEEASGVDFEVYKQLQTRLRNRTGIVFDKDGREVGNKFMGILSTNPEDTWIKDQFLLRSAHLHGSETVDLSRYTHLMREDLEEEYATFISTSFDNPYLPHGTIARISAGRDQKWKDKYLYSILDSKEGLVFKDMPKHYVEPFDIPDFWKRIGGFDPGIGDPTACLIGAIDPSSNIIYFYLAYSEPDKAVTEHGYALAPKIKGFDWLHPLAASNEITQRSKETGHTYKRYFKQATGITLREVSSDILAGIEKVKDYIYEGRMKFFNNLTALKYEQSKYAYPPIGTTQNSNKPVDKYNHLMDCLRYAIMPLPRNPADFLGVYTRNDIMKARSTFKNKHGKPVEDDSRFNKVHVREWR